MQYEVSPSGIRDHATSLAGIEGDVRSCSTAAETTLDASAFGVVNSFLAATVGLFGGAVQDAVSNAADDLGETVDLLRAAARNHETTDGNARERVRGAVR